MVSASSAPSPVFGSHEFATKMTGQQEVPPVETQAIGEAIFVQGLSKDGTMHHHVNVTGIEGAAGENGPVVVTLFNFESPQSNVIQNGTFASTNLEGQMRGNEISDLITSIQNGTTYVNVHTEQNPEGEIRGQLVDIP